MPLVLLSSDSYSTGRNVAQTVAEATGYRLVDREILSAAARRGGVDEGRLIEALEQPPPLIGRFSTGRRRSLAWVQQAALSELLADNAVSHGVAAHLYVRQVSHAIKLRVLSEPRTLGAAGAHNGSGKEDQEAKARKRLSLQQKKWSLEAFAMDETDVALYDIVADLGHETVNEVVNRVQQSLGERQFQANHYSTTTLRDLALASRVRVVLLAEHPEVRVRAVSGTIVVETRGTVRNRRGKVEAIKELAGTVDGVDYVEVHVLRTGEGSNAL